MVLTLVYNETTERLNFAKKRWWVNARNTGALANGKLDLPHPSCHDQRSLDRAAANSGTVTLPCPAEISNDSGFMIRVRGRRKTKIGKEKKEKLKVWMITPKSKRGLPIGKGKEVEEFKEL